ncbi:putative regulator of chromosome condensation [Monocercomonoides exilis]|uniref:putative regulator of chromosome condensation n=1 Tax=Monocercomonoides exilis TaxID=2049356 RepID=UPI003559D11B|nr:putative regulator of chromosome condensation [Monocercomonoides exilis]|eukprot:MONOS_10046.1-p1 / transcript=MONOS_10046.1 / gene=MONOS_10046 / organism=Monocercomonoides_exilis_PA203 / gene_product=regulator of chromosome condensation / transcript_product=regulator of chromosome condensation / location=Mono_scaffold00440:5261-7861(+) / protein_length=582 / sequence_SO=supercontig / SO=protein_coding / is_pseudo=false
MQGSKMNRSVVYSIGCHSNHCLGSLCSVDTCKPQKLSFPETISIVQVSCGKNHAAALSANGQVYLWGSNENSQLGVPRKDIYNIPFLSQSLQGIRIKQVGCGSKFTAVLSNEGKLYVTGQIIPKIMISNFSMIDISSHKATSLACAGDNLLLTTETGSILSLSTEYDDKLLFTSLPSIPLFNGAFVKCSTSGCCFAVSTRGDLVGWGCALHGEIPLTSSASTSDTSTSNANSTKSLIPLPQYVGSCQIIRLSGLRKKKREESIESGTETSSNYPFTSSALSLTSGVEKFSAKQQGTHVMDVSCGAKHVAAILSNGECWTWGRNDESQLGSNFDADISPPRCVLIPADAVAVACGASHTVLLTSDGKLYGWGRNSEGQLGISPHEEVKTPTLIPFFKNKRCINVSCGLYNTYVVVEEEEDEDENESEEENEEEGEAEDESDEEREDGKVSNEEEDDDKEASGANEQELNTKRAQKKKHSKHNKSKNENKGCDCIIQAQKLKEANQSSSESKGKSESQSNTGDAVAYSVSGTVSEKAQQYADILEHLQVFIEGELPLSSSQMAEANGHVEALMNLLLQKQQRRL